MLGVKGRNSVSEVVVSMYRLNDAVTWMVVVGAMVTLASFAVWLIGLIVVVRGTDARDRAKVIRAYARCLPSLGRLARGRRHSSRP
jgi:hypothetical protein